MSPKLLRVVERAKTDPSARFNSLAQLIDEEALKRAYGRERKNAAVGVDGIDKENYGQNLEGNIRALHERLKSGRYWHKPIRRVHIAKGQGKTRPIGISTIEDKIVQGSLCEVLGALVNHLTDRIYVQRRGDPLTDCPRPNTSCNRGGDPQAQSIAEGGYS